MKPQCITLIVCVLVINGMAQDTINPVQKKVKWKYQDDYEYIKWSGGFGPGMTDDQMAGLLLYRGGRSLTSAAICEVLGVGVGGLGLYLYDENKALGTGMMVGGGVFMVIGIVNIFVGYSKISKAGIILQHKSVEVRGSPTGMVIRF